MKVISFILAPVLACLILATSVTAANENFRDANNKLADSDAQDAIAKYFGIADQSGTSYPLAKNIAVAAKQANEPGILEWADTTTRLRQAEWALFSAALVLVGVSILIAIGVWKRWSGKKLTNLTLLAIAAIAAFLQIYWRMSPPPHDTVVIHPSTAADGKMLTTANLLISPFDTAEITGTLTLGTHIIIDPTKTSGNYQFITTPATQNSGWIPKNLIRQVGQ